MKFKQHRAFTLSEVFVAIVVIAIVGSVCIAFLKNRNDYTREYMYYSVYQNLVKAVDTIMEDPGEVYTQLSTCNTNQNCMKLKNNANLCEALKDKLNFITVGTNCTTGQLLNGAEFIANKDGYTTNLASATNIDDIEERAYTLVVDIDGQGANTKNTLFYDIMPFYITDTGKVIPLYSQSPITTVRGYNGTDTPHDAAGNAALMSFDVVYTDNDTNRLKVITNGHSLPFPEAACLAGYVSGSYCTTFDSTLTSHDSVCTFDADCRIRLIKKLKWSK